MADQFGRVCIIQVGEFEFTSSLDAPGLRMAFTIERDKTAIPNSAEISIWNLSEGVRNNLESTEDLVCKVTAGYPDNEGLLFHGYAADVQSVRDDTSATWVLQIAAGDAEDKYGNSKVELNFAAGTPVHTVLKKLVAATGVGKGNVDKLASLALPDGATALEAPAAFYGSAMFELQTFCESLGLDWSIQDEQFLAAPNGEPYIGEGPLISPDSGLIGSPTVDKAGVVSGVALLNPKLTPGVGFRLESKKITGDHIVSASTHVGDTFDPKAWLVHWNALPVGVTSEGLLPPKKDEK